MDAYYTPRFNEVDRGVYWYHLVRLSVCPSVDRIVSALYLQQYSLDPFHICTSYQATSEGVSRVMRVSKLKFWRIFKICNFDFVIFWLGIQYDSMVWVIMRRRGYPQNAGVLVVLVLYGDGYLLLLLYKFWEMIGNVSILSSNQFSMTWNYIFLCKLISNSCLFQKQLSYSLVSAYVFILLSFSLKIKGSPTNPHRRNI